VAPANMAPDRHSSWQMAGMPNRVPSVSRRCTSFTIRAPTTGSTGRVPSGRVIWPIPLARASSGDQAGVPPKVVWLGATSPVSTSRVSQTAVSCATFSAVDMRPRRSRTRSATGAAGSR